MLFQGTFRSSANIILIYSSCCLISYFCHCSFYSLQFQVFKIFIVLIIFHLSLSSEPNVQNLTVLDICNSMNSLKLNCHYHLKQKSPVSVINHSCRWPLQRFRVIRIFIVNIMFFSFTVFVFCNSAKYLQLSLL